MSYNGLSASGGIVHSPTLRGLVNSGADLLKSMYDIRIFFPGADGKPNLNPVFAYPITVRATGFQVPEVSVGTYDIKYHGMTVKRPNGQIEGERTFSLTFREDAAFQLRSRFSAWMAAVADPITGGISNSTNFYGTVEVGTIGGAYYATSTVEPTGDPTKSGKKDIFAEDGCLTTRRADTNPLAIWRFYHVWVGKVGGVDFATDAGEPNTFEVQFYYMDCDYPMFGGNKLADSSDVGSWMSSSSLAGGAADTTLGSGAVAGASLGRAQLG